MAEVTWLTVAPPLLVEEQTRSAISITACTYIGPVTAVVGIMLLGLVAGR